MSCGSEASTYGSLTLIFGPMFSSKTQTLKALINVNAVIGDKCLLISHVIDNRQNLKQTGILSNHEENGAVISDSITQIKVSKLADIPLFELIQYDVIAIDESQFFPDILLAKDWIIHLHKKIFAAGLLATSEGTMFGEFYKLIPYAKKIKHLKACCKICREEIGHTSVFPKAIMTKCIVKKDEDIMVGSDGYIPTCLKHWSC